MQSKRLEFFLFNDLLMYAKPVKVRKTGQLRNIVYKQIHRSLIEARALPNRGRDQHLMELVLYGEPSVRLHLRFSIGTQHHRINHST